METCYFCQAVQADPSRPLSVVMRKTLGQSGTQLAYKRVSVPIPACGACRVAEEAAERKRAWVPLSIILVPAILGAAWAGWHGVLLFGALGIVGSMAVKPLLDGRSPAHRHPKVQELVSDRWDFV